MAHADALAPMVAKLAKHSELGALAIDALRSLPHRKATFGAGKYLIREGDSADSCILVVSGFTARSKMTSSGSRQILCISMCGDLIDLQSNILGDADHNIQSLSEVTVAYIPQQAILDIASAHPAVARALWRELLVDAAIAREWIVNLGRRDARQRIAHLLCELALRQKDTGLHEGPSSDWPMTQEQLADVTGLTAVHVNRMIQTLRKDGLIETGSRTVTITDWPGLQRAGEFDSAYLHQVATPAR